MAAQLPMLRTSERTTWRECPQKWWWGYREGLVSKGAPNFNLWFGSGWHEAMASHYQPGLKRGKGAKDPRKVWEKYCADEMPMMMATMDTEESKKFVDARDLGIHMLDNYLAEYGADDHMFIIAVEQTRSVTVYGHDGQPLVTYYYTMDGVYRDRSDHGRVKILEHKTALIINLGHLPLDDQAGSYLAFETLVLRDRGILKPGESILDITYNVARKALKKEDDRPTNSEGLRLNKDGSVSARQKAQEPIFVRKDITRSREARDTIVDRVIVEAEEMRRMRENPDLVYKNPHSGPFGCTTCPFFDMCTLHEEGGDWEDLRDWKYKQQDPYGTYRKAA